MIGRGWSPAVVNGRFHLHAAFLTFANRLEGHGLLTRRDLSTDEQAQFMFDHDNHWVDTG